MLNLKGFREVSRVDPWSRTRPLGLDLQPRSKNWERWLHGIITGQKPLFSKYCSPLVDVVTCVHRAPVSPVAAPDLIAMLWSASCLWRRHL